MYDSAKIYVKAGDGGGGLASFRREKFVPRGGPDGGDGGDGGHVYLVVNPNLNTLVPFQYQHQYRATSGGSGRKSRKTGKRGDDLQISVPPGTIVRDAETNDILADLIVSGDRFRVARGGQGGLGNPHFATSTNQAPRIYEKGEPGEERWLLLELKLIADVGLVGYPNAGKSTLLSAISAARPKIGNYPFTTLEPNLGVVEIGDDSFVVADIPGLIEGAHRGIGLGHEFLRHVERTRVLIHLLDASGQEGRDPLDDYRVISDELTAYQPELAARPTVVALNKIDLPEAQADLERLTAALHQHDRPIYPISAATGEGLRQLLFTVADLLRANPKPVVERHDRAEHAEPSELEERLWKIQRLSTHHFQVTGIRIERLVRMTDFANEEAADRLQRVLAASGLSQALVKAGIAPGDVVHIAGTELVWDEAALEASRLERAAGSIDA